MLVEKKTATLFTPDEPFRPENGGALPVTVAYETYGEYDPDHPNAVLVAHALTGDSHAAGRYLESDRYPGWWDGMIGPGRAIDTNRYFVICQNVLGGCQGTTGPSSLNPETGRPYGSAFPMVTIRDMVRVERELLRYLGIGELLAVIGGSMGGMQVLEWAVNFPELVRGIIPIATNLRFHPQGIAFNEVQRRAIMSDPAWRGGDYYDGEGPRQGLAIARMLGMITYRSDESMHQQFGREEVEEPDRDPLGRHFQVESYLHYQGDALVRRFDANSYLYLTRAMDYHDVSRGYGSHQAALGRFTGRALVVGIRSDLLFPPYQQAEMVEVFRDVGIPTRYFEMDSPWGHDAFLVDIPLLESPVATFLEELAAT